MGDVESYKDYGAYKCSLALSKANLLVKLKDTTYVTPAGAGDKAFGVAIKSSRDPTIIGTNVYLTGQPVPIRFGGIIDLNVTPGNTTIAFGDKVQTAAAGEIDKATFPAGTIADSYAAVISNLEKIVGTALGAVASSTGGTLKTLLHPHSLG